MDSGGQEGTQGRKGDRGEDGVDRYGITHIVQEDDPDHGDTRDFVEYFENI